MQWHNIPSELRALPQWIVAGPNRVPINPRTGHAAEVNDSSTWVTYEEAVKAGYQHIGFVLAPSDPFTIIDLDDKEDHPATPVQKERHQLILNTINSYTERSAGGRGYHIVVKGIIPSGIKRDNVEVYSSLRYMICTGDVIKSAPIADYQDVLIKMYGEMKPSNTVELEERGDNLTDQDIVDMAINAVNADKFNLLCKGDWQAMGYQSQSEADFALLSMFAFYSQSNEQVRRLFRYSNLGKREKAVKNDTYIDYALEKIRAKQPAPIDLSTFVENLQKPVDKPNDKTEPVTQPVQTVPSPPVTAPTPPERERKIRNLTIPPGLIGEMAEYFYNTAVRPVPDIALAAAISLAAGITGRSYNISKTGLNQYLILVAKTGTGKEGAASGIETLLAAVKPQIPMIDQFMGPSTFASGQALIKVLNDRPCFISILGEFGLTLQQICDPSATSAQIMLRKVLLDLYSKSGWNNVLRPSVYSDVEKNTNLVQAPNVSILGETTPETFFEGLDSSHISDGLIPRFTIIQYMGKRPSRNGWAGMPPPQALVQRFADLVTIALTTMNNGTCAVVATDPQAQSILDEFDTACDEEINDSNSEVEKQIWNRGHLKALKLSALLAVGCNPHQPVITHQLARWSIDFIESDIHLMADRFSSGDIGMGDAKLGSDLRNIVKDYLTQDWVQLCQYGTDQKAHKAKLIPYQYLMRRSANLAAFRKDRRGSTAALKSAIQDLIDSNLLIEIPSYTLFSTYGLRGRGWVAGPTFKL